MNGIIAKFAQLGNPLTHIQTLRIKTFALRNRIEYPKVGRCVGASASSPLPTVIIGSDVAVDKMTHKKLGTPLPWKMQVLHQETRNDHSYTVMHPPRCKHLLHASIDNWKTGFAFAPCLKSTHCISTSVVRHFVHFQLQVFPHRARLMKKYIGIKFTPTQLASKNRMRF